MRITMAPSMCRVILSLLICFLLQEPTQAIKKSYIVYLGSNSFGQNPSSVDAKSATNYHYELLGSYLGSIDKAKEAIFYSYNRYINGFAAVLDEEEAANIAKHPKVLSVFLNTVNTKLQTTRSWSFLGLERNSGAISRDSIWAKSMGEDVIIANFDSGVWPESKSFSDEGMGPIPTKWHGICQTNDKVADKMQCNRKLIGVRYLNKGFIASVGADKVPFNGTFYSARDYDGHGTHTLSTAGGNFVHGASVFGLGSGTTSGGSPKARVATYKICYPSASDDVDNGGCADADILAAFEAAIADGVDVISASLSNDYVIEYKDSGTSIGSFHAVANGITVVGSAGNRGPDIQTVANLDPWIITVAASSLDREFSNTVVLGNKKILRGESLSDKNLPAEKLYPLISGADAKADGAKEIDGLHCKHGALDPNKVNGKIVVCLRGGGDRTNKSAEAASLGAVGMILANDDRSANDLIADPLVLPASNVNYIDGNYIFAYVNRSNAPMAYISNEKTKLGTKPSPFLASFSSRGPNALDPSILKPDITAPGINIIASYSEASSPTLQPDDKRTTPFITMSGTSMSCPHVSGLVGLLRSLHPDWSPEAIKSAIMTTATIKDNTGLPIMNSSKVEANPFDYGAGHIQPNLAADPGLVYDLNTTDYLNYLCGRGYNSSDIQAFYNGTFTCPQSFNLADFNYPSITIVHFDDGLSINVTRTLTNVGSPSTYKVRIKEPLEAQISVEPNILSFMEKGEKKEFRVSITMKPQNESKSDYLFGGLDWTDDKHHVWSPIVIKPPN